MQNETLAAFKEELCKKVENSEMTAEDAYEAWIEAEFKEVALVEQVYMICEHYGSIKDKTLRYELIKKMLEDDPITQDYYEDAIRLACRKIGY